MSAEEFAAHNKGDNLTELYGDIVCVEGLWKHTRHPNLWYELQFWFGMALIGQHGFKVMTNLFAFFGPVVLYGIMDKLTIRITEGSMKRSRPAKYLEYLKTVPKMVPRLF